MEHVLLQGTALELMREGRTDVETRCQLVAEAIEHVRDHFLDAAATDNEQDRAAAIREARERLTVLEADLMRIGDEVSTWRRYLEPSSQEQGGPRAAA